MTTACCDVTFWLYIIICFALVIFAGCMSGLTLGLMSLGLVDLEVLQKSGTEQDKKYAAKIYPVVKNQHLLLCTLLIGNALAMESLPIFLDEIVPSWLAILLSVSLILIFAEIVPQAVCTRYGLFIGATAAPFVQLLVFVFFPIAYPISKVLDWILGHKNEGLFRRAELSAFVNMHAQLAGKGGDLSKDETTIIAGALEMANKTAEEVMTPIEETFSLDINTKLEEETLNQLMLRGHSRVPVFSDDKSNIFGLLLVKNLLNVRPEDNLYVRNLTIRKLPRVNISMPLYDILNEFQKGHSHIAAVVRKKNQNVGSSRTTFQFSTDSSASPSDTESSLLPPPPPPPLPPPTTATGKEGSVAGGSVQEFRSKNKKKERRSTAGDSLDTAERGESRVSGIIRSISHPESAQTLKPSRNSPLLGSNRNKKSQRGEVESSQLSSQMAVSNRGSRKWEHTGFGKLLLLEGTNPESLSFTPEDEEVVGIVTMEDVIEELLQEEILDETDEYMSVHDRIQVSQTSDPPSSSTQQS